MTDNPNIKKEMIDTAINSLERIYRFQHTEEANQKGVTVTIQLYHFLSGIYSKQDELFLFADKVQFEVLKSVLFHYPDVEDKCKTIKFRVHNWKIRDDKIDEKGNRYHSDIPYVIIYQLDVTFWLDD